MGKEKLAVDIPVETKAKLSELAYVNRLNLTQMVIKLIEDASKN